MPVETTRGKPEYAEIIALLGRITFAQTFGYLFRGHAQELSTYLDTTFGAKKTGPVSVSPGMLIGWPSGIAAPSGTRS
jgi:hypothetical protein